MTDVFRELRYRERAIYGEDSRRDLNRLPEGRQLDNARSVAALISKANLRWSAGQWKIEAPTLQQTEGVCTTDPAEPFFDQPTAAFCTGFLVRADIIATAAHCFDDHSLAETFFVFGYEIESGNRIRQVASGDIRQGGTLLASTHNEVGEDWALIRLSRPMTGRPVLGIRRSGKPDPNLALYVIGCAVGLPLKFADGANIRDNSPTTYFVSNLDSYGGNSGSPVFSGATHNVEGILVRGETDFRYNPDRGCRQSLVCPSTGCRGEDATRITIVAKRLDGIT